MSLCIFCVSRWILYHCVTWKDLIKINWRSIKIKWKQWQILLSWAENSLGWWLQPQNYNMFVPWKKSYDKPRQHIKKQIYHLAKKGPYSQSYVQMWELTMKKAEHWRIDAFELWCSRRLLRVPWTARRSNQSILKDTNLEYSLEELVLKLKLQYFVHLIGRTSSLEKTLLLGKTEGKKNRGATEDEMVGWHH